MAFEVMAIVMVSMSMIKQVERNITCRIVELEDMLPCLFVEGLSGTSSCK